MDWAELVLAIGDRGQAEAASAFRRDGPATTRFGVYAWWADKAARQMIEEALEAETPRSSMSARQGYEVEPDSCRPSLGQPSPRQRP